MSKGWRARLRYEFDKSMAAGPIALIGWLAVISLIVIILAATVLSLSEIGRASCRERVWTVV